MSFIGSNYSGSSQNNFYKPEPSGVDASRWARYPAIENVDIDGYDIINAGTIVANDFEIDSFDVDDLTINNNLTVVNNTQTDTLLAETSMTSQSLYLGLTGTYNGRIRAVDGQVLFVESAPGGDDVMFLGKNDYTAGIVHQWNSSGEQGLTRYLGTGGAFGSLISHLGVSTSGDISADGDLTIQGETLLTQRTQVGDNLIVFGGSFLAGNITANSNLSVAEDVYVSGTSFLHGVEALDAISVVSPSVSNKFSMKYNETLGVPRMTLTSDGGATQDYIQLSDTPSGLIQLLKPSQVEADMTITSGGLYATDDGVYAGDGSGGFNIGLECDTGTSTGSIVLKPGVGTIPMLDFTPSAITLQNTIQQATGTASFSDTTVDSLEVEDGEITLPTTSYSNAGLKMEEITFVNSDPASPITIVKPGGIPYGLIQSIWQTPTTVAINGITGTVYNVDLKTPYSESTLIQLVGSGGSLNINIYETDTGIAGTPHIGFEKVVNIHRISGTWSCFLNLLDKDGNPSTYKYSYLDMSSGSIVGRDIVQRNASTFAIYTAVHSFRIVSNGDGSDLNNIMYYVEYK